LLQAHPGQYQGWVFLLDIPWPAWYNTYRCPDRIYLMNIKLIQLINNDYIICEYEEMDEEPSLYMKNPYKVSELSYWDYDENDKHFPPANAVFLQLMKEKNIKNDKEIITIQSDYAQLVKYPSFTKDVDILLNSDKIMTIVEPAPEIVTLYLQLISK
jgi:hypothetical protein